MYPMAYFSTKVGVNKNVNDPFWKDLLEPAGPWQFQPVKYKDMNGLFVAQKFPDAAPVSLKYFTDNKEGVEVQEGLWYFSPKELPSQLELAKENVPFDTEDVILSNGKTLTIPLARSAPRLLNSRSEVLVGEFWSYCR